MMKREKRREEEREREILGKLGAERRRMIQVRVIGEFEIDFGFGAKLLSVFKYEVQVK
jgi:hypothetical protein